MKRVQDLQERIIRFPANFPHTKLHSCPYNYTEESKNWYHVLQNDELANGMVGKLQ